MQFQSFLIKYAEIGTKGKNRYVFEDALMSRIASRLKEVDGEFRVTKEYGRIYVKSVGECDCEDVIEALKRVFGIAWICPMFQMEQADFDEVTRMVLEYIREVYPERNFTFKVNAKRADKSYPVTSEEMNQELGYAILSEFPELKVDVHDPDVMIHVEIRNQVNIYSKMIPGPGGMPVGTNGKAMLLLSGGIDSPVAGHMIAKRGVRIEAVYYHAPPYTSERAKDKVIDLAKEVARYSGRMLLHIINFTDIQMYIYDKCPHDELTIIMRRYMMKIAEAIAREDECMALITGESVGQVASQTVQSLVATDDVCTMPVFRPLIGFDKQEIVEYAQKIGTYETSILPYEDCCTIFVAKHPVTKPNLDKIRRSEENLKDQIDDMVKTAIESREMIWCG